MTYVQMFQSVFVFLFTVLVLLAIPVVIVLTLDVPAYNGFVDGWNGFLDVVDHALERAIERVEKW